MIDFVLGKAHAISLRCKLHFARSTNSTRETDWAQITALDGALAQLTRPAIVEVNHARRDHPPGG
jgi:hypothetical protein